MSLGGAQKGGAGAGGEATPQPPALSVVMPVHNALPYLDESIQSVLEQTFTDFEFIILDDASTDGSTEKLREWAGRDARIRLCRSERNLGLSGSSNSVVRASSAEVVARMDADDVCHPERLMRQWEVLRGRSDVGLIGTLCDGIDAAGRTVRPRDRWRVVRRSALVPFPHGSVMFRRAVFDAVGGYREECLGGEDQDLFYRMAQSSRAVILPDVLYHYRYHADSSSLSFFMARAEGNNTLRRCDEKTARPAKGGANGDGRGQDLGAIRYASALRLWAGHRPETLRLLLARGVHRRWNAEAMYTLAWAAWARLSPGSLRACLRLFIRVRDRLVSLRLRDGRAYEWQLE
ncbi:MAG TPA: glycosyltransferase family A protein [Pyrinomonadaceae bacterium]|nr:glycosyltransferase family A protein [Pyrinomonadaceae bacterium]